ncbi:MAG: hypothetical protein ACI4ME_00855 [Aristaeellaceae bacterium]
MKKVLAVLMAVMMFFCVAFAEETTGETTIESVQDIPTTSFMFEFTFTFGLFADHFSNMDDMTIAGIDHAQMTVNGDENRMVKQCIYNLGAISQEDYDSVLQLMLEKYPTQEYSEATGVVYEFPAECYGAYTSGNARTAEDETLKCERYHQWLYYHTDDYGLGAEGIVLVDFSLLTNQNGKIKEAVITYTMLPAEADSTPLPANHGL